MIDILIWILFTILILFTIITMVGISMICYQEIMNNFDKNTVGEIDVKKSKMRRNRRDRNI